MKWFFGRCKGIYAIDGYYESKWFRCLLEDNHPGLHAGRHRDRIVLWANNIVRHYEEK